MAPTQGADPGQHVYAYSTPLSVATVPMAMCTPWLLFKNVKYTNLRRAPGAPPMWDTEVGVCFPNVAFPQHKHLVPSEDEHATRQLDCPRQKTLLRTERGTLRA